MLSFGLKYKGNGHFRSTFQKHFCFGNNFSTNVNISNPFSQAIYILPVFMVILRQVTMANFNKIAIMAILVWVAINVVNIGIL